MKPGNRSASRQWCQFPQRERGASALKYEVEACVKHFKPSAAKKCALEGFFHA